MSEHLMQSKVVQYVRNFYPEVIICSIPNGAGTTVKNRIHLYTEGLLAGMPDLFIAEAKKGFNGLFIEMKTDTGVESPTQKEVRKRLETNGYLCYVARSDITAINIIEAYLEYEEIR
jgi:VRR-NUC domain